MTPTGVSSLHIRETPVLTPIIHAGITHMEEKFPSRPVLIVIIDGDKAIKMYYGVMMKV